MLQGALQILNHPLLYLFQFSDSVLIQVPLPLQIVSHGVMCVRHRIIVLQPLLLVFGHSSASNLLIAHRRTLLLQPFFFQELALFFRVDDGLCTQVVPHLCMLAQQRILVPIYGLPILHLSLQIQLLLSLFRFFHTVIHPIFVHFVLFASFSHLIGKFAMLFSNSDLLLQALLF